MEDKKLNSNIPKRRKAKENPYNICRSAVTNEHFLFLVGRQREKHQLVKEKSFYDVFNGFELEDLKWLNEYDRHEEHSKLSDAALNKWALSELKPNDKIVYRRLHKEQLHNALTRLSRIQVRFFNRYFLNEPGCDKPGCRSPPSLDLFWI